MGQLERFRQPDFEEMKKIEVAIIRALQPFKTTTDPLLAAIALTRCLRVILRLGDHKAQAELLPVLKRYLDGRTSPELDGLLWTPGGRT